MIGLYIPKNKSDSVDFPEPDSPIIPIACPFLMDKFIPSNINLSGAEIELISEENKEFLLKNKIDTIRDDYDFILIDCPPSLGLIVDNALFASDSVIIPVECGFYAYDALTQMINKIDKIQNNKNIDIEGILLTKLDNKNTLGYEIVEKVKFLFPEKIFKTIITRSSHIQEAPLHGQSVLNFSFNSRGSKEYRNLAKEILENNLIKIIKE